MQVGEEQREREGGKERSGLYAKVGAGPDNPESMT